MSGLVIRIIGGVCGGAIGTFISGQIYDYIKKNKLPSPSLEEPTIPPKYESKIDEAKTFMDILNIEMETQLTSNEDQEKVLKSKDKFAIKKNKNVHIEFNEPNEEPNNDIRENIYTNDAIYDNYYLDYFT